jgi:hypothetical protein
VGKIGNKMFIFQSAIERQSGKRFPANHSKKDVLNNAVPAIRARKMHGKTFIRASVAERCAVKGSGVRFWSVEGRGKEN